MIGPKRFLKYVRIEAPSYPMFKPKIRNNSKEIELPAFSGKRDSTLKHLRVKSGGKISGHLRNTTLDVINFKIQAQQEKMGSNWFKIKTLMKRTVKDFIRNPESLIGITFIQLAISICFGALYYNGSENWSAEFENHHNRVGLIFLCCIVLWQTAIISGDLLLAQRDLFVREVQSGYYTAGPYFIAKYTCEVLPNRLIPLIFYSTITYWMSGLWPSFNAWILWVLPLINIAICSGSLMMFYSVLMSRSMMMAMYIITAFLLFVVAGLTPNLANLTPALSWLQWISPARYAFTAQIVNEFENIDINTYALQNTTRIEALEAIQDLLVLDDYNLYWRNVGILWGFTVVFSVGPYFALRQVTKKV